MINGSKEQDLAFAAILYITRCIADGDEEALVKLQCQPTVLRKIQGLSLDEIERLAAAVSRTSGSFLSISVADQRAVAMILTHIRKDHDKDDWIEKLIEAEAPHSMVNMLYGMSGREHSMRCKVMGLGARQGRIPEPDDLVQTKIWEAWTARAGDSPLEAQPPQVYLDIAEETQQPLRVVWRSIKQSFSEAI